MVQEVGIQDNPDAIQFLRIISDFKSSNFGKIFAMCPGASNTKLFNVKNLF